MEISEKELKAIYDALEFASGEPETPIEKASEYLAIMEKIEAEIG